jgi:hypothetical protein
MLRYQCKYNVLKNPVEEINTLLVKDNLYCIDELLKVLPQEKRINAMLVKRGDSETFQ